MNCLITIRDYHNTDGEIEKAELTTSAEIYGSENNYIIEYDEQSDELRGCHTVMTVTDGNCIEISRTGSYTTNLKISSGKRNICCYSTPMGTISMGVRATGIKSDYKNGRLNELDFTYTLDFDNVLVSKNRIILTAKYREEK